MTSYYDQVLSFEMRAVAAPVIVIGEVDGLVETSVTTFGGEEFLRSTFEVSVNEVLKGQIEGRTIRVQWLSSAARDPSAPAQAQTPSAMQNGTPLVLMLVPEMEPGTFVPYFSSAYPVGLDGTLAPMQPVSGGPASQVAPAEEGELNVERLRAIVAAAAEASAAPPTDFKEETPNAPSPPVWEMPGGIQGGGRNAAPEAPQSD